MSWLIFVSWEDSLMKKFLVLYMAKAADFKRMMKNSTPEQQKKGMDAWMGDHRALLGALSAPSEVGYYAAASRL